MSIREVIAIAAVAALLQGAGHAQTVRLLPKKSAPKSEAATPRRSATQSRRVMTLRGAPQGARVLTQKKNKESKPESGVKFRQLPRRRIVVVPESAPKGGRILQLSPRSGRQAVRRRAPAKRQPNTARRRIMLGAGSGAAAQQPPVRVRGPVSSASTARLEVQMAELTNEIRELRHLLERLERRIGNNRRGRRRR